MKPVNVWIYFFFLLVPAVCAQEVFKTGILAGISTSQVHGDTYSGFNKVGLFAGAFVKKKIYKKWDVKFEIDYVEKGSRHTAKPDKGNYNSYYLNLNYMEVPLMIRYWQKKFIFSAGPAFAALVRWKEENDYGPIHNAIPFRKSDFTFLVGMSYAVNQKIEIDIRYTNSYIPVRKFDVPLYYPNRIYNLMNKGLYNNVLSFTLHYCFARATDYTN